MARILIFGILLHVSSTLMAQYIPIHEIQGATELSPYDNQTVSTKGAVTGVYKDGYFIRENAEKWGSIYIYDPGRNPMPRLGDTVALSGLVTEYYTWTEIKSLSEFSVISTGNPEPTPVILNADEIEESWESCLITIENLTCSNDNLGYGEWELENGDGTVVVNDLGVAYTPQLGQQYTITGALSFSFEEYKIEPRTLEDIQILAPVYLTEKVSASSIQTNEITIGWKTNAESTSEIYWGLTPVMEKGQVRMDALSTEHAITIDNLNPSELIYVQAFSVIEADTAKSPVSVFITASESSGEIRVLFNKTYTDLTFQDSPEFFTHHLADTIIAYIEKADETLDIAFYDFTDHSSAASDFDTDGIKEAILAAASNGVQVRLITDAAVADAAPGGVGTQIPRLEVAHDGIMHHKFIIVDHNDAGKSWLVTGSTNPNFNNTVIDFNNLLAIQDQSLAKAYLIEFNEMWGGESNEPDLLLSRTGSLKVDNSPHEFSIGGNKVELYFSPSDHTTSRISDAIHRAGSSIEFAVMAFTENVLGDAITAADNNGVEIHGIIDYVEYSGSEFDYLVNSGIDVLDYKNPDESGWPDGPTLHHKYAVVDGATDSALVITGSHNWTASAESRNDENTLIIHNEQIARLYRKEYSRIADWLRNPPSLPVANDDVFEYGEGNSIILDVLENDNFSEAVTLEIISDEHDGTYEVLEDQTIAYYPGLDFVTDTLDYKLFLDNSPQFPDTAKIIINRIIFVPELFQSNQLMLFPNPSKGLINISTNPEVTVHEIQVFDFMGRNYLNKIQFNSHSGSLDLSNLSPGIYFIELKLENELMMYKRLVIE